MSENRSLLPVLAQVEQEVEALLEVSRREAEEIVATARREALELVRAERARFAEEEEAFFAEVLASGRDALAAMRAGAAERESTLRALVEKRMERAARAAVDLALGGDAP